MSWWEVVGRYLVGLLQSRTPSFFEVHKPGTFSTFATPVCPLLHSSFYVMNLSLLLPPIFWEETEPTQRERKDKKGWRAAHRNRPLRFSYEYNSQHDRQKTLLKKWSTAVPARQEWRWEVITLNTSWSKYVNILYSWILRADDRSYLFPSII